MTSIESRLERLESEVDFRAWIRMKRMFENMSIGELENLASTGQWPDRVDPPPGASRLDAMDRQSLLKLWKEDQAKFAGRNREDIAFFTRYGHWTEQACGPTCKKSPVDSTSKHDGEDVATQSS